MISAKFVANFDSFYGAVQKAEQQLVDLSDGADTAAKRLDRMVTTFSGRKLVQDAVLAAEAVERIGGASKLTEAELQRVATQAKAAADKLRAMGEDVPVKLQNLAGHVKTTTSTLDQMKSMVGQVGSALGITFGATAVVGAVVNLGKQLLADADALTKLHDKTGISVQGLQVLTAAGDAAGNTIDDITSAVTKMQIKVAGNDQSAVAALHELGINFSKFKALDPDEQFIQVGSAIQKIVDPANQARLAVEIFGKSGAEVLPTLKSDMEKLKNATFTMSDGTVAALDAAGDAWAKYYRNTKTIIAEVAGQIAQNPLGPGLGGGTGSVAGFDATKLRLQLEKALSDVPKLFTDSKFQLPTIDATSVEKALEPLDQLRERLEKSAKAAKEAAQGQRVLDAAAKLLLTTLSGAGAIKQAELYMDALHKTGGVARLTAKEQATLNGVLDEGIQAYKALGKDAPPEMLKVWLAMQPPPSIAKTFDALPGQIKLIEIQVQRLEPAFSGLTPVIAQNTKELAHARATMDTWIGFEKELEGIGTAFRHLAQTGHGSMASLAGDVAEVMGTFAIVAASTREFRKGLKELGADEGNFAKGIAQTASGLAGMVAAMDTATSHASKLGNTLSGALAGAEIGAALGGGIGAAIGAAAGGLLGFLRGGEEKKINQIREAFVQLHGGLAALNLEATRAGVSLGAMLNAKNPEQYQKAIDDLNKAFDSQKAKVEADSTALGLLLKDGESLGIKLPPALEAAIKPLVDMGKITGDVGELFKRLSSGTEVDFKKMQEVAGKYGIDLAALGPAFESAKLGDIAKTITNDFDFLKRGGADVDAVLAGMKTPIQGLVTESLKAGLAIPENFRPWLEQLAKTGQLTDENGDKINDVSKLKFADPIVTEFDKLIAKLQELIDKISGTNGLTAALAGVKAPPDINIGVHFNVDDFPDVGVAAQRMASGGMGRVTKPTLFLAGEAGAEDFAFSGGGKRFAGASQVSMADVVDELQQLRQSQESAQNDLPRRIRDAILLAN